MNTDLIHGDPDCRYKHLTARVAPSVDPDAAIDVACFMSTDTVDADNEVLLPEGIDLSRFEKNPVVLLCHSYGQPGTYYPLPVGKVEWTKKRPRGILAGVRFTLKTPIGREVKALFDDDMLRSFSVGFQPIESSLMTGEEAKSRPDWLDAFERSRGHILVHRKWHLLELSVAPVPSNPDALVTRYKSKGVAPPEWLVLPQIGETELLNVAAKGRSAYHSSPIMDLDWNPAAALESLRRWASSNGTGDSGTLDWPAYSQAFLWHDDSKPEDFGSYSLPVKQPEEGRLVVVRQALVWAAAILDGRQEGVAIPENEREGARIVLSKYEADAELGPDRVVDKAPEALAGRSRSTASGIEPEDHHREASGEIALAAVRVNDHVMIAAPGFSGVGVVETLHTSGLVPDVPNTVPGTPNNPAARVLCFKTMRDGFVATDYHLGVLCKHLEVIDPLPPPCRDAPGEPPGDPRFPPLNLDALPPLVPLTEQQILEGAVSKLDSLLRLDSIRKLVSQEFDRRLGFV